MLLLIGLVISLLGGFVSSLVWLFGGLSLLVSVVEFSLWLMGEYIGRTYQEVKKRPRFFIEEDLGKQD